MVSPLYWHGSLKRKITTALFSLGLSIGGAATPSSGFAQTVSPQQAAVPAASQEQEIADSNQLDLKLAAGKSLGPDGETAIFDPYMLVTNASSTRRLVHYGLSAVEPEQEGALGVLTRTAYLGLDYYLEYLLSIGTHELGHYGELRAIGVQSSRPDLSRIWYFGFGSVEYADAPTPIILETTDKGIEVLQQDLGFVGTSQGKMAAAGRGELMELLLAREVLKDAAKKGGKLTALEAMSYAWGHSRIMNLVDFLTSGHYGSIDIHTAGADADIVAYNRYSLFHSLFPYPLEDPRWRDYPRQGDIDNVLANAPSTIQRPRWPGGDTALYNYFLMNDYLEGRRERKDPHQLGVMAFNSLDPYTLVSFYGVGRYLALDDESQQLPPRWAPQFNGYFGVPGPQYGLSWHIPTERGLVIPEFRLGVSPELAGAIGIGIEDVRIPRTRLSCSVMGELIYQRDGTPVDASTIGGTLTTEITVPVNAFRLGAYHLYQSNGVWSPYRFGLGENHTVGVVGSVRF